MKQAYITGLSILSLYLIIYIFGCNINQASYEPTGVGGTITDSSTGKPVEGVKVWIEPTEQFSYTDTTGFYYIGNINCGSSAGNFFLNYEKDGYDSMRLFTILYAGDTTKRINWALLNSSSEVFKRYNVTLDENVDIVSLSNLDAFNMVPVNGAIWTLIDMAFVDSAKIRDRFFIGFGGYAVPNQGLESYFTNKLYSSLSQGEFDTLSRIDVGNRPIIPDIDFPYNRIESVKQNGYSNSVYGFYLKGRHYLGYQYNVYGLMRINNFYFDNNSNLYKIVVDLKVNRRGHNNFIPFK